MSDTCLFKNPDAKFFKVVYLTWIYNLANNGHFSLQPSIALLLHENPSRF